MQDTKLQHIAYRALGHEERVRAAAQRWPLLRAVDQHLELSRWRRQAQAGDGSRVVTLEPRGATPAEPWFLSADTDSEPGAEKNAS